MRPRSATIQAVLYGSTDGGTSWHTLRADSVTQFVSEVTCATGAPQTVYFVRSRGGPSIEDPTVDGPMVLEQSVDFGQHWRGARYTEYMDAAVLHVRRGRVSERDSLYLFADGRRDMTIATFDGGRTLGGGLRVLPDARYDNADDLDDAALLPGSIAAGLYIIDSHWWEAVPDSVRLTPRVLLQRIGRDGRSLGAPITIATVPSAITAPGRVRRYRTDEETHGTIAADLRAHGGAGRVYVAWNAVVDGRMHILCATSVDSGATWSSPRVVDDMPTASDGSRDTSASTPSLAVNTDGIVGLEWAEFDGRCWRFAASFDEGATFLPSVALNSCPRRDLVGTQQWRPYLRAFALSSDSGTKIHVVAWHVEIQQHGTGMSTTADGAFHPAWVVQSDGEGALYTRRITVSRQSPAPHPASPSAIAVGVAEGRGVRVRSEPGANVDFTTSDYDEATGEFTLGAVVVRQPRNGPLRWPAVVRVKRLSSPLGPVEVVDADNHLPGVGATWTISGPAHVLPAGTRAALNQRTRARRGPYAFSLPRDLHFRLTGPATAGPSPVERSVLDLDVEIGVRE